MFNTFTSKVLVIIDISKQFYNTGKEIKNKNRTELYEKLN